jgi:hypothetical protein
MTVESTLSLSTTGRRREKVGDVRRTIVAANGEEGGERIVRRTRATAAVQRMRTRAELIRYITT